MRKIFLPIIVILGSLGIVHAQTIQLPAIPYAMHLENQAVNYAVTGFNHLQLTAPARTDLYISPTDSYSINKSPRIMFRPDSCFILTAKIKPGFKTKWDAGALMIYNDSTHFAKFCFENDFKGQSRVVSVVCNDVADDCNSMPVTAKEIYYRITGSVKGNAFNLYYSTDGKSWFIIRSFRLVKTDKLQIGFSAQSPVGKGCTVDFSDINFQQRSLKDYWAGN